MAYFTSGRLELHYEERGSGVPVVMLHGFGMTAELCWVRTGWLDLLEAKGFRAIALDSRGHGLSDKPTRAADYAAEAVTQDVINLLDHLGVTRAHLVGHSMGARTAFDVALKHPARVASLLAVSVGANLFEQVQSAALIKAFEGDDPANVPPAVHQTVTSLLSVGNDKEALIACLSAPRPVPRRESLHALSQPVLVACGEQDQIVGDPEVLASALQHAKVAIIQDREHTDVLASDRLHRTALGFLAGASQPEASGT